MRRQQPHTYCVFPRRCHDETLTLLACGCGVHVSTCHGGGRLDRLHTGSTPLLQDKKHKTVGSVQWQHVTVSASMSRRYGMRSLAHVHSVIGKSAMCYYTNYLYKCVHTVGLRIQHVPTNSGSVYSFAYTRVTSSHNATRCCYPPFWRCTQSYTRPC